MYSEYLHINILTALMRAHGLRHVVVSPGNRNAPLAHNFEVCPDLICHAVTDERSAAFTALGLSEALDEPVAVCVTSGSALLGTLPAAAEATYRQRGILVISADRPAAWIGQLDGQTMPQQGALGSFAGLSVSLPEIHCDDDRWLCNRLVNEAFIALARPAHPSVHINVPVSEPLFRFTEPELPSERVIRYSRWSPELCNALASTSRLAIVLGQTRSEIDATLTASLSERALVLSDQLSFRGLSFTDRMMYLLDQEGMPSEMMPEKVVYLGGNTVSKRLRRWLRTLPESVEHIVVSEDGALHDVSRRSSLLIEAEPQTVLKDINMTKGCPDASFLEAWGQLEARIRRAHEAFRPGFSSMLAVKLLSEQATSEGEVRVYANSMSVRLGTSFDPHFIHCNRGLNGIEGTLSTAVGMALARPERRVTCVIGDLSAFYDQTALSQQELGGNLRILLLNNGGGAIFRAFDALKESPARDRLVTASHATGAEDLCRLYGITYLRAEDEESLREGIAQLASVKSARPVLLEVVTDGEEDMRLWREFYRSLLNSDIH